MTKQMYITTRHTGGMELLMDARDAMDMATTTKNAADG